ncbi:hypothetical protein VNO77_44781 [Canavalia gladiata]|uniref:Uncharacterized protein n=1 Tax=Canavalia gladiata TaxID=3824 RepID=A0AAN9JXB2_CANGL
MYWLKGYCLSLILENSCWKFGILPCEACVVWLVLLESLIWVCFVVSSSASLLDHCKVVPLLFIFSIFKVMHLQEVFVSMTILDSELLEKLSVW